MSNLQEIPLMDQKKIHEGLVQVAVANLLGYRVHTIVPNVSWGLALNHECDLLVLDKSGRFTEIEIKVTASDLKADFKKKHGHTSKMISRLVYAMPIELCEKYRDLIPKEHGIISVEWSTTYNRYAAEWYRLVKHRRDVKPPDHETISKFMHLGCMRIWTLKHNLYYRN